LLLLKQILILVILLGLLLKQIIMKHKKNLIFILLFISTLGLGVVSCSSDVLQKDKSRVSDKKAILHTHKANNCIDAVTHSHPNGDKKHLHYFHHCKANAVNPNAHSHPSKKSITGYIRHTHPNGSVKHTHGH